MYCWSFTVLDRFIHALCRTFVVMMCFHYFQRRVWNACHLHLSDWSGVCWSLWVQVFRYHKITWSSAAFISAVWGCGIHTRLEHSVTFVSERKQNGWFGGKYKVKCLPPFAWRCWTAYDAVGEMEFKETSEICQMYWNIGPQLGDLRGNLNPSNFHLASTSISVTVFINCKTSSTAVRKDEDDFPDVLNPFSPATSIHSNCKESLRCAIAAWVKIAFGAVVMEYERTRVRVPRHWWWRRVRFFSIIYCDRWIPHLRETFSMYPDD